MLDFKFLYYYFGCFCIKWVHFYNDLLCLYIHAMYFGFAQGVAQCDVVNAIILFDYFHGVHDVIWISHSGHKFLQCVGNWKEQPDRRFQFMVSILKTRSWWYQKNYTTKTMQTQYICIICWMRMKSNNATLAILKLYIIGFPTIHYNYYEQKMTSSMNYTPLVPNPQESFSIIWWGE